MTGSTNTLKNDDVPYNYIDNTPSTNTLHGPTSVFKPEDSGTASTVLNSHLFHILICVAKDITSDFKPPKITTSFVPLKSSNISFSNNGVSQQFIKNQKAIHLIQSWLDDNDDIEEQTRSLEQTIRDLDEERLSSRKLFP